MSRMDAIYKTILDQLRTTTNASRTTLRLASPGGLKLIAESVSPETYRMAFDKQENAAQFPTYEHLEHTHDLLIQSDLTTDPVRPPQSLIDRYNVLAQMLAPVIVDDQVVGVISVHIVGHTREWTPADIQTLQFCQGLVTRLHTGRPVAETQPAAASHI